MFRPMSCFMVINDSCRTFILRVYTDSWWSYTQLRVIQCDRAMTTASASIRVTRQRSFNFYRAAWNAAALSQYSDGNSVCLSVCPSVCQTRALWQKGRKLCLDFYIIWKNIYPSFLRRMVGGGDPFYLKLWVNWPPLQRNRRFWTNNRS